MVPSLFGLPNAECVPSDSECNDLTSFSMSLAHKYVKIKEPYNQDIIERITTKHFFKKKTDFT